jgi:hypothetical protein
VEEDFVTLEVPQVGQVSRPCLACRSKAVLLANQPSNWWPFLQLSR